MGKDENSFALIDSFCLDVSPEEIHHGEALNARSIATQAYLYQLPAYLHMRQLMEYIQGRRHMAPDEAALGGWMLIRRLSTSETTTVSPNVDTLYGATFVWLERQGPVVVTVPAIKDRYYSLALCDSWLNVFNIIGTRTTGTNAGSFLIVPATWEEEVPPGIKEVYYAPTSIINIYQRIYISEKDDICDIHALQDQIQLAPLENWKRSQDSKFPKIDASRLDIPSLRALRDPLQFFEMTNIYTAISPPPLTDASLLALFRTIGIGPGGTLPTAPHLRTAIATGARDAQTILNATISAGPFRNGWRVPNSHIAKPGPYILTRAVSQLTQLGAFPNEEAMYFFSSQDGENQLLNGQHRYTLTFAKGQLPPIDDRGFWSLTMYNEQSYLIKNRLKRHVIRPNSEGLTYGDDGSLTIYLQAESPGDAPVGNWLPSPQGVFIVALRTYLPRPELVSGEWFPPAIVQSH